jgi:hypothetical protein
MGARMQGAQLRRCALCREGGGARIIAYGHNIINIDLPHAVISEDPLHAGEFGKFFVRGMAGGEGPWDPAEGKYLKVAAAFKHLTAYSREDNRMSANYNLSLYDLTDTYVATRAAQNVSVRLGWGATPTNCVVFSASQVSCSVCEWDLAQPRVWVHVLVFQRERWPKLCRWAESAVQEAIQNQLEHDRLVSGSSCSDRHLPPTTIVPRLTLRCMGAAWFRTARLCAI